MCSLGTTPRKGVASRLWQQLPAVNIWEEEATVASFWTHHHRLHSAQRKAFSVPSLTGVYVYDHATAVGLKHWSLSCLCRHQQYTSTQCLLGPQQRWASLMAQGVKVFTFEPESLSLISGTHIVYCDVLFFWSFFFLAGGGGGGAGSTT